MATAVTVVNGTSTKAITATTAGTLQITYPANMVAGDVVVAHLTARAASSEEWTVPANWTRVTTQLTSSTGVRHNILWHVWTEADVTAYGSGTTTITFTFGATQRLAGSLIALRNVNNATPVDATSSSFSATGSTTITYPTITTTRAAELWMVFGSYGATSGAQSSSTPTSFTELTDQVAGASSWVGQANDFIARPSTGATSTITTTLGQSVDRAWTSLAPLQGNPCRGSAAWAVTTTATLSGGNTVLAVKPTAGSDDAYENVSGTVTLTDSPIALPGVQTGAMVGIRFPSVTIDEGSRITAAFLTLNLTDSKNDSAKVTIYAEAADNSATFAATSANISARTKTTISVAWGASDLGTGQKSSPDLRSLVQRIVARASWASGNALSLLLQTTSAYLEGLTFTSKDAANGLEAVLTIHYKPAPATTVNVGWGFGDVTTTATGTLVAVGNAEPAATGVSQSVTATSFTNDFAGSLPSLTQAKFTGFTDDPTAVYTATVNAGNLRVTANVSAAGATRMALYPTSMVLSRDAEIVSTWVGQDGAYTSSSEQEGHAHRIVASGQGSKAITITKNVSAGNVKIFNMHVMDASLGANGNYNQIGTVVKGKPAGTVGAQAVDFGSVIPDAFPYKVKTRVRGLFADIKVWLTSDLEPAWDDATHVGTWLITDSTMQDVVGAHGVMVDHLPANGYINYDDITITRYASADGTPIKLFSGSAAWAVTTVARLNPILHGTTAWAATTTAVPTMAEALTTTATAWAVTTTATLSVAQAVSGTTAWATTTSARLNPVLHASTTAWAVTTTGTLTVAQAVSGTTAWAATTAARLNPVLHVAPSAWAVTTTATLKLAEAVTGTTSWAVTTTATATVAQSVAGSTAWSVTTEARLNPVLHATAASWAVTTSGLATQADAVLGTAAWAWSTEATATMDEAVAGSTAWTVTTSAALSLDVALAAPPVTWAWAATAKLASQASAHWDVTTTATASRSGNWTGVAEWAVTTTARVRVPYRTTVAWSWETQVATATMTQSLVGDASWATTASGVLTMTMALEAVTAWVAATSGSLSVTESVTAAASDWAFDAVAQLSVHTPRKVLLSTMPIAWMFFARATLTPIPPHHARIVATVTTGPNAAPAQERIEHQTATAGGVVRGKPVTREGFERVGG